MNGEDSRGKASMLSGSVWKGLVSFAVPLLIGSIFQQLYNTVDSLVVVNLLGDSALAAVSSAANLINLLVDAFIPASNEPSAVLARAFGECREGQIPNVI